MMKAIYCNFIAILKLLLLPISVIFIQNWTSLSKRKYMKWILRILQWTVILYIFEIFGACLFQDKILYHNWGWCFTHENPIGERSPLDQNLAYKETFIKTHDGEKLHTWFIPQPDSKLKPTLIYYKGNYRNIGNSMPKIVQFYQKFGCNIIISEYRGYGNSTGIPSEKGLQIDAETVLDYALNLKEIDTKKIIIHGFSMGGAVAGYIAHKRNNDIAGIILENTFGSVSHILDYWLINLYPFKKLISWNYWPTVEYIKTLTKPLLVICAEFMRANSFYRQEVFLVECANLTP